MEAGVISRVPLSTREPHRNARVLGDTHKSSELNPSFQTPCDP